MESTLGVGSGLSGLLRLPPGFDRDMRLLLLSMSARRVVMGFIQIVLTIYLALLGFSPITIGLLVSVSSAVSAVHHITFGFLSDRFGRKTFLLLGSVFAALRVLIFAFSTDFWLLIVAQGLGAMGEGAGAGQPVVSGYIADKVDIRERVPVFSTIAITNAIAASVGSAIAGLPQVFEGLLGLDLIAAHKILFLIGAGLSLVSFLLLLPLSRIESTEEVHEARRAKGFKVRSWGPILKFSLVRSTNGLSWGLIESLLPLYFFLRFSVGSDSLGPLYAAARILSVATYLLIPSIVARIGEISLIFAARIVSASATMAFALTNWYPLAAVLLVVFLILTEFTRPVRQSFATGIVDPDETATAIGIANFARMGVRTVAPSLAGYMFEAVSLSMPFFLGSALTVLNGALYYVFFRPRGESQHQSGDV